MAVCNTGRSIYKCSFFIVRLLSLACSVLTKLYWSCRKPSSPFLTFCTHTRLREIVIASNISWVQQPFNPIIAGYLLFAVCSQKGPDVVCVKDCVPCSFCTMQIAKITSPIPKASLKSNLQNARGSS